ncbi:MAG TPA: ABC transporter ATP-binding protein [Candidatus Binataceae bacterium]|nr:ABC transporter ATP-binding protein [Candidatus Binataceae bacterium]
MRPIIKVENVSKVYRIGGAPPYLTLREGIMDALAAPKRLLRSMLSGGGRRGPETVTVLSDVSFEVAPGEVLGVIGRNGAGKSTLLKILARITEPTNGTVELYGRVASLLEVGTGFHPELTGRENIFLSGAILGMRRGEIARKFDEIVNFAEIERFIDTPVKRYSSGMYVRLAFAVAAHLEPEILLVDEVLAVGDAAFQKRCLGKMGDVARDGRTIVFVSHNMAAIESLCGRCLLTKNGVLAACGEPKEVVTRYLATELKPDAGMRSLTTHPGRRRGSIATMTAVSIESDGEVSGFARMGAGMKISVSYSAKRPLRPVVGIIVKSIQGAPIFAASDRYSRRLENGIAAARATVVCGIEPLQLMPGTYVLDIYLGDSTGDFDVVLDAISFEVLPADMYGTGHLAPPSLGPVFCAPQWTLHPTE